jgi:hypothetical protein
LKDKYTLINLKRRSSFESTSEQAPLLNRLKKTFSPWFLLIKYQLIELTDFMDRQEIGENSKTDLEYFIVGKFVAQEDAEMAAKFLEEVGFPIEQIQIETLSLRHSLPLPESEVIEGGKGGAIVGAALGITIGLSISLIVESLPDANLSINLPPLLIIITSGVVGALALGLIGGISSGQVPKTHTGIDENSTSFDYGLIITGKEEDLDRAKEILRQQGIRV